MFRTITGFLALLLGSSCSFVIDVSEHQCEETSDCSSFAGTECIGFACVPVAVETKFSCQDKLWKPLNNDILLDFEFTVTDLSTNLPVVGATMHECNSLFDRECEMPVETQVTDVDGKATFQLPEGFRGHIFLPEAEELGELAPMLLHVFPPPDSDDPRTLTTPLGRARLVDIAAAASVLGVEILPNTGAFLFTAEDCFYESLAGVTLSVFPDLPETAVAYLSGSGIPDPTLTATGTSGSGAIVNLPAGNITIKAIHDDEGVIFEQTVVIAPDSLTTGGLIPSPSQ